MRTIGDEQQAGDVLDIIELDVNLADAKPPVLLPKAYYEGEVRNITIKKSGKGNDYYNIELLIPPDQFPANFDPENYPDGAMVYYNRLLTPGKDRRSVYNIKLWMEKLDLPTNTNKVDPNQWIGRPVKIKLDHNTYQGVTNMQVAGVEASDL